MQGYLLMVYRTKPSSSLSDTPWAGTLLLGKLVVNGLVLDYCYNPSVTTNTVWTPNLFAYSRIWNVKRWKILVRYWRVYIMLRMPVFELRCRIYSV